MLLSDFAKPPVGGLAKSVSCFTLSVWAPFFWYELFMVSVWELIFWSEPYKLSFYFVSNPPPPKNGFWARLAITLRTGRVLWLCNQNYFCLIKFIYLIYHILYSDFLHVYSDYIFCGNNNRNKHKSTFYFRLLSRIAMNVFALGVDSNYNYLFLYIDIESNFLKYL